MKNNRLNCLTAILVAIFTLVYIVALIILLIRHYPKSTILSISADYVTVVSFVIIVIQLIAFVKDSRRNEFRSRKEAAYHIAREYADKMLSRVSFIQAVLSLSYDSDPNTLQEAVCKVEISGFSKADMQQNTVYKKYIELFIESEEDKLSLNHILIQAVVNRIPGFLDINSLEDNKIKNHIANTRFKIYLFDTLNVLECFAMSVNQNVSDSEMLYSSLHQTFIKFVHFVYPFICCQNEGENWFYPNIIQLYQNWGKKEDSEKKLQADLEKQKNEKLNKGRTSAKPL